LGKSLPTATHEVALVHETVARPGSTKPVGPGRFAEVHVVPDSVEAKDRMSCPLLRPTVPTRTQLVALVHDTPPAWVAAQRESEGIVVADHVPLVSDSTKACSVKFASV